MKRKSTTPKITVAHIKALAAYTRKTGKTVSIRHKGQPVNLARVEFRMGLLAGDDIQDLMPVTLRGCTVYRTVMADVIANTPALPKTVGVAKKLTPSRMKYRVGVATRLTTRKLYEDATKGAA